MQPTWAPPASVFGPVWTVLYAMMAISAWLVWRSGGFRSNLTALSLFLTQLFLNGFWSWVFFTWQQGALAFINIVLLWIFIALTMFHFYQAKPLAAALLVPYMLWVSFAAALNYAVWQLNPHILG
ncbi:UNVERIFIED_CONTAM: hypothetical protein GTU68_000137 [Idotea baltica]|nr:hypothetical protein [Idotea baltica]